MTACPASIRAAVTGVLLALPLAATAAPSGEGRSLVLNGAAPVPACGACHGTAGEGNAALGAPALAGDGATYLREQLANFAAGRRTNPAMQSIAGGLTPAQQDAVAAYFAALPPPAPPPAGSDAARAGTQGARLATQGDGTRGLAACTVCHGPDGSGAPPAVPHLTGLTASYIAAQLDGFRTGARPPGPLGAMGTVARHLSAADIAAISAYFATPEAAASDAQAGR